jgi:hypothetical protein
VPKLPEKPINAAVISIYAGVRFAGGGQIITLNRGGDEGLTAGDTLQLWRTGETIQDRTVRGRQFVKLPDEQLGLAFVFRVFPTISYALLINSAEVAVGDRASSPADLDLPRLRATETEADRVLRQPLRTTTVQ